MRRVVAGLLLITACERQSTSPDPDSSFPSGIGQLSVIPVDSVGTIVPLGHIQPIGHTLPTDHIYFYFRNFRSGVCTFCGPPTPTQNVRAPADGTVTFIIQPVGTDFKIQAQMTKTTYWYLDHVALSPSIKVGTVLKAGDVIGTTPTGAAAIDLGYVDYSVTQPYVMPIRYGETTLHSVSPLKYYIEPSRSQLYAKVSRPPDVADKDGGIAFDVAGPRVGRIAWGGLIGPINVYSYRATDPRPADVTPASGIVHYHLSTLDPFEVGELVVQMIAVDRIRIEYGSHFTANALIYKR
jgi:hypothetical protein